MSLDNVDLDEHVQRHRRIVASSRPRASNGAGFGRSTLCTQSKSPATAWAFWQAQLDGLPGQRDGLKAV